VIGPLLYPRRYAPGRTRRPPRLERLIKMPAGWVVERLAAPFARWDDVQLAMPDVPLALEGLGPAFAGYRIALVSDLHHGPVVPARWLARIAAASADARPDLIALGGDFVAHARSDLEGLEEIVARFRAPDGVVAVLGNHDHWVDPDAVARRLEQGGAAVLCNQHRLVSRGGHELAVGGVDDFTHGAVRPEETFAGVAPHVPRVLLSHNPDLIEYLPAGLRVDVMLSGHTHNGQAHLPIFGPVSVPSQFGARYLHGLHRVGGTWLYVSAGVGSGPIPLRWGNPPELPIVRLEAAGTT
jgi:uncharacterized protein